MEKSRPPQARIFTIRGYQLGRARRGVSGALYPKSAYAGLNILLRALNTDDGTFSKIGVGRCATNGYEPRQVREEAAVNNAVCVVTDSNLRFWCKTAIRYWLEKGCTAK